jgi:hypothetical protein
MGDDEKRSGTDRRATKERRSGADTRSEEEKRLIGERRSQSDRRSDQDRRAEHGDKSKSKDWLLEAIRRMVELGLKVKSKWTILIGGTSKLMAEYAARRLRL